MTGEMITTSWPYLHVECDDIDCTQPPTGEVEAVEHARTTGHVTRVIRGQETRHSWVADEPEVTP